MCRSDRFHRGTLYFDKKDIEKEKKMKRIISTLLALIMIMGAVFAFSACSSASGAKDLEEVKAKGKLVVGMECAYAPYNWAQATENEFTVKISDNMYADGYDVQISKLVAEHLGVELVIKPIEWNGLTAALNAKDIDMIIAGMSPTADRKLSIDFSDTYLDSNLVIVIKKDSAYAGAEKIADFAGAKITGQQSTFHYDVIDQIEGVKKQTALPDFAALIQALSSGAIDGYVCEKPGAISAVTSNSDFTFIEFEGNNGFSYDPDEASIAVGVRKGSSLTAEINKVIASLSVEDKEGMMTAAIGRQPVSDAE